LPVLFVSGHVGDALDRHGGLPPDARILSKPFSSRELVEAVRGALESVQSAPPALPGQP
jgi:DNA-binding response OmpR family regulator